MTAFGKKNQSKSIMLVGLCCIDEVSVVKKYPAEDSETRIFEKYTTLGGNVANNAVVLRQLTDKVQVCASLPTANPQLSALLAAAKIDTTHSIERTDPTTEVPVSTCIVNETTGSRTVFHYRGNLPEINAEEFEARVVKDEVLDKLAWIHFEGRNFDQLGTMMQKVHHWRKSPTDKTPESKNDPTKQPVISVELEKIRDFEWFDRVVQFADIVFMSKDFAKHNGWHDGNTAVQMLPKKYPGNTFNVVCPWGDQGVYGNAFTKDGQTSQIHHIPGEKVTVVDSLGAGDCFIGACIWALWSGFEFVKSLEIANHIAAQKCTQRGLQNLDLAGINTL